MKGSAIVTALILIVIGTLILGGYLLYISRESGMTKRINDSVKALYIAEAGLERKLHEISTNDYNDIPITYFPDATDTEAYYTVDVVGTGEIYVITSTGRYRSATRKVRQNARVFDIWDNAIFSAEGTAGQLAGCMNVRGTVFVLGEESFIDTNESGIFESGIDKDDNNDGSISHLPDTDYAIDATGNFYIGNNYDPYGPSSGISSTNYIKDRMPSIFDPELGFDTLNAELDVKYGKVNMGGSVQIGNDDQINGPMSLVNVPDGFNPADPTGKVFVVEGGLLYDRSMFSEKMRFPNLADRFTDPLSGTVYEYNPSYDYSNNIVGGRMKYLRDNGLKLTTKIPPTPGYYTIPEDISPDPDRNFNIVDPVNPANYFTLTNGHIDIGGIVYIDGDLTFDRYQGERSITYAGTGSIALTGNLTINANLYPQETGPGAFPQNIIGFMTPQNINMGTTQQHEVMGIFYAGGFGRVNHPTKIAGSFIAHQVTLNQVPDIFQVKNVKEYLPPGMIDVPPVFVIYSWREVFGE